jgi:DNA adenine methylase
MAGTENKIVDLPEDLYDDHVLLSSGNSSFRRVIGKRNSVNVKESLYTKVIKDTV